MFLICKIIKPLISDNRPQRFLFSISLILYLAFINLLEEQQTKIQLLQQTKAKAPDQLLHAGSTTEYGMCVEQCEKHIVDRYKNDKS